MKNNKLENSKSKATNTGLKGIYERKSGKFEACVRLPKNRENIQHKAHLGHYDKLDDAIKARINFIKSLI